MNGSELSINDTGSQVHGRAMEKSPSGLIDYWMQRAMDISKNSSDLSLFVGAVLLSKDNRLICSSTKQFNSSWISNLLNAVKQLNLSVAESLFLTVNTRSPTGTFDLQLLLDEICINKIYIGLPDPKVVSYLDNDPVMTCEHVYRCSDRMQRNILEQNNRHFLNSRQSIKESPYYDEIRISKLIIDKLGLEGINVMQEDINSHKSETELASLISDKYCIEFVDALHVVNSAIAEAFNIKYSEYNYENDARLLFADWKDAFFGVYKKLSSKPLAEVALVNVGVANGDEAINLFPDSKHACFIDIAENGLLRIKKQFPSAQCITASASDLSAIPDQSKDIYVSLRTYNSSFFNINAAVREAYRVLKSTGGIIVSIANGFLCPKERRIIPGLLIPGTRFVDIYRGLEFAYLIRNEFAQAGFKRIEILATPTEIYISACKSAGATRS